MKSFRAAAAAIVIATAASCSGGASVSGVLEGADGGTVVVKTLSDGHSDTLKVSSSGSYKTRIPLETPDFVYISRNGRQVASLLLSRGEKVKVSSDTLGRHLSVEGSGESIALGEVEKDYAAFCRAFSSSRDASEATKVYIDYYRGRMAYVMTHPRSLTSVRVLFQKTPSGVPVFNQLTDAIVMGNIADSLAAVYPGSGYVASLRKEADSRRKKLELSSRLRDASVMSFPEIELPDRFTRSTMRRDLRFMPYRSIPTRPAGPLPSGSRPSRG